MINKYYKKNKDKLQKKARKRYQNVSEEEKEKRHKKTQDRCKDFSEEEETSVSLGSKQKSFCRIKTKEG